MRIPSASLLLEGDNLTESCVANDADAKSEMRMEHKIKHVADQPLYVHVEKV